MRVIAEVKCAQRKMDLCQTAEFGSCIPAAVDKHIGDWGAFRGYLWCACSFSSFLTSNYQVAGSDQGNTCKVGLGYGEQLRNHSQLWAGCALPLCCSEIQIRN